MTLTERRRVPRFPFHSRGSLTIRHSEHPGTIVDISVGGALFQSDSRIKTADRADCHIAIYHSDETVILSTIGSIVYSRGTFLGIRFINVDAKAREGLKRIMEMNLGTPKLMGRDLSALLSDNKGQSRSRGRSVKTTK
jgi:hypothetical protein